MAGLYIHVPFCARKCGYCAFCSIPLPEGPVQERFVSALEKELDSLPPGFSPDTIFIGGGTPSSLDLPVLERLLAALARFSPREFSCEANPGTLDAAKATALRHGGVGRLSIGVQSFDPEGLSVLGRIHSGSDAEEAVRVARAAGFENISLDLMFGIPGQTLAMLEADLDRLIALQPGHVSAYNLMLEEGTPLAAAHPARPGDEMERTMYDRIRQRLAGEGFRHYEISNFARPGFECLHNLLYWTGGEYIGCGPAAHSHWEGLRWAHAEDIPAYMDNGPQRIGEERLDPDAKARETLVMNLRRLDGAEVPDRLWQDLEGVFAFLQGEGLVRIRGRRVQLTEEALFVSDSVFAELV